MYSIVILSRNPVNASRCVMALYQNEPELDRSRIVIVDDGAREKAEVNTPGVTWLDGEKPFCFSRNANIGVRHAFD
jgi:GT2 family glycosyltransferase